ncbi:MAG: hypothetical protein DVB23_003212 [Verrucomicrobia bacterium]|nr:MAG: hypothetical protein DVB23_003212 [Verrucomicrobiota bacterium]
MLTAMHVAFDLAESISSALRRNPEGFAWEMRVAAALKCFGSGMISPCKAAEAAA